MNLRACMPQPEFLVFSAHEKFDPDGTLTHGPTAQRLAAYLAALAEWMRRFVPVTPENGVK